MLTDSLRAQFATRAGELRAFYRAARISRKSEDGEDVRLFAFAQEAMIVNHRAFAVDIEILKSSRLEISEFSVEARDHHNIRLTLHLPQILLANS